VKSSSLALTIAAVLSSAAFAQQEPPSTTATPSTAESAPAAPPAGPATDVGAIFDKLDANHDGKLSQDEAQAHPTVASHFASADASKDGVITKDEFMAAFKPQ
jgi:hypothetical protein